MTKGFLIIDQLMNTIILPYDDVDLVEFLQYKAGYPNNINKAHQHRTLKELDSDVRKYLKNEYDG